MLLNCEGQERRITCLLLRAVGRALDRRAAIINMV